jgi:putative ABC transport system permease protein
MIIKTAWKNIWFKPLNTALSIILLTASVAIISLLMLLQQQFENKFSKNIEGVDMVMGAKGSPLQLILSSVYQLDAPTGNINYKEAQAWMKHPFVETAIPLAFGDNYLGYKIVGTTPDYVTKFDGTFAQGEVFKEDFQVVVGSKIAQNLGLKIGDEFFGTHGDSKESEHVHDNHAYTVVGILAPTDKVIDNLILCSVESVWSVHEEHNHDGHDHDHEEGEHHHHEGEDHEHDHDHDHSESREITAVLLKIKNKMAFVSWPRLIPQNTNMQVASPAIEINRLFTLFGFGLDALQYLAYGIMLISGISIFIALYNTLKERKYEFALMRISGAGRGQLLGLVLFESLLLCVVGFILGTVVGRIGLWLISGSTAEEYKMEFNPFVFLWDKEGVLFLITIFVGIIAALIPAIKAYKLNISKTLNNA